MIQSINISNVLQCSIFKIIFFLDLRKIPVMITDKKLWNYLPLSICLIAVNLIIQQWTKIYNKRPIFNKLMSKISICVIRFLIQICINNTSIQTVYSILSIFYLACRLIWLVSLNQLPYSSLRSFNTFVTSV